MPDPSDPLCSIGFLTCWQFARWSEWRGSNPQPHAPKACAVPIALHPDMCPCAGFRRRFNRRAAGSIVSPELDRGYCPRHLHTESNCAPVAPALAETSRSRTCLVAQQRGLEPPTPFGVPAFQAGRLPLSHCCMLAWAGRVRTGTPGPRPRPGPNKRERKPRRIARLAAAAGIEPTFPGSEPGALPMDYTAVWPERDARPGKRERRKRMPWLRTAGDRGGRRTLRSSCEDYRFSGPAGIASCRPCHMWSPEPASVPGQAAHRGAAERPANPGHNTRSSAPYLYYASAPTYMTLFEKIFGGGGGARTRRPSFPDHPISSRAPYQFGHPSK